MQDNTKLLDEVVVTAMGIARKEETLSYSTQTVGGDEFTRAKEANLINSLQGKSAVWSSRLTPGEPVEPPKSCFAVMHP